MKVLSKRLSPAYYDKGRQWGKLIAITGGAQSIIQLVSLVSGILIIRLLSTQEYALYTLANAMLGTMVMLADNGISSGVMAEAGKAWQDKSRLGIVLSTGFYLRKKFALFTLAATMPVLIYLLLEHNATWVNMILIVLAIIPAFYASLSDTLLEIAPKLHQDIQPLQKNAIEVNVFRLVLSVLLLFVFPFTCIALIANGIPRVYGNYKLKKIAYQFADDSEVISPVIEKEIMKGVKRTLPIVIYHCVSSQLAIWLVSIFGTTDNIAQIGALGRLSMIFALLSTLFSTLVIPRFARMIENRDSLLKNFLSIQVIAVIISLIVITSVGVLSSPILWVLGAKYKDLGYELLLVSIAGCIGFISGVSSQLVICRGWFMNPYYLVGVNLFSTIIFLTAFNNASLVTILYYNIIISAIIFVLNSVFGVFRINKIENQNNDE